MKSRRAPGFLTLLAFIGGLILTALVGGFIVFVVLISRLEAPQNLPKADGIVVWTGKGGDRVTAAIALLEDQYGERLLISGTNADLSRDTIINTLSIDTDLSLIHI